MATLITPAPGSPNWHVPLNTNLGAINDEVEQLKDDVDALEARNIANILSGTSTTSTAIATGTKALTTQVGLAFVVGQFVRIASVSSPGSYMGGTVASYVGTTLTVAVTETAGSGTYNSWTITTSAPRGNTGATGAAGPNSELAYAESIVQFEVAAGASVVDVTGLSISFTMPARPVLLRIGGMARYPFTGTSGAVKVVETTAANASIMDKFVGNGTATSDWADIQADRRITGTAGVTRSFKMQAVQRAGNAWSIAGNQTYPQWIGAYQV